MSPTTPRYVYTNEKNKKIRYEKKNLLIVFLKMNLFFWTKTWETVTNIRSKPARNAE